MQGFASENVELRHIFCLGPRNQANEGCFFAAL
jgi:hypothetical protein